MRRGLIGCALVVCACTASAVLAQDRPLLIEPYGPGYGDRVDDGHAIGYPGVPPDALPTPLSHGGSCVKMCAFDQAPCDPDYWKVADRLCNYNQRG